MTKYFDGKQKAKEIESELKEKVTELKKRGITPKLASFQIGNNKSSALYLKLKQEAAQRVGAKVDIHNLTCTNETVSQCNLDYKKLIEKLNEDKTVHGIMLQLPLPQMFTSGDRDNLINMIDGAKDVDGMRGESEFISPVVRAVMLALSEAETEVGLDSQTSSYVVVGARGFEGEKITKYLRKRGVELRELDLGTKNINEEIRNADVIVSVTGSAGLIKPDMVQAGAVIIDVGAPRGDFEKDCYEKAGFVSPVPGGLGPVVISYLLSNLIVEKCGKV